MKKSLLVLPAALVLVLSACSSPTVSGPVQSAASAGASAGAVGTSVEPSEEPSAEPEDDGTAEFGQTYTWEDGISVTVTDEGKFRPSESAFAEGGGPYRKYKVTIANNTGEVFDPNLVSVSASSGDEEAGSVVDSARQVGITPDTKLRDGKKVSYTVAFGVKNADDVTLEVAPDYNHDSVLYAKG